MPRRLKWELPTGQVWSRSARTMGAASPPAPWQRRVMLTVEGIARLSATANAEVTRFGMIRMASMLEHGMELWRYTV